MAEADRAASGTDEDNSSVSSNEDQYQAREAQAMQAELETMKEMEKAVSISHDSNRQASPRMIPSIAPMGGSVGGGYSAVSPVQVVSAPVHPVHGGMHSRNNSNAGIPQMPQQQMNPRLSGSSQGSRGSPGVQHAQPIQQFHAYAPMPPQNNMYAVTPNYQMQQQQPQQNGYFQPNRSNSHASTVNLDDKKEDATAATLSAIWKEIKEIKDKLIDEQAKNEELRYENRRLRDAVRQRNKRIKELEIDDDYYEEDMKHSNNNENNENNNNNNNNDVKNDNNSNENSYDKGLKRSRSNENSKSGNRLSASYTNNNRNELSVTHTHTQSMSTPEPSSYVGPRDIERPEQRQLMYSQNGQRQEAPQMQRQGSRPYVVSRDTKGRNRRDSISSIGTEETLPPETRGFSGWMIGFKKSLKARKCNWF